MARSEPIACTLNAADATAQLSEWRELAERARGLLRVSGGVVMHVPARFESEVRDLAAREASCCAFLDLAVARLDGTTLAIRITSDQAEALPVIEALVGLR